MGRRFSEELIAENKRLLHQMVKLVKEEGMDRKDDRARAGRIGRVRAALLKLEMFPTGDRKRTMQTFVKVLAMKRRERNHARKRGNGAPPPGGDAVPEVPLTPRGVIDLTGPTAEGLAEALRRAESDLLENRTVYNEGYTDGVRDTLDRLRSALG